MTPYYEDDYVTIWHGDCREVTGWLDADVLLTDPPYGRAWKQGDTNTARGKPCDRHEGIAGDADTSARDAALSAWGNRPGFVFGDLLLPPPHGTKLTLVYDKGDQAGFTGAVAGFRRNAEAIYVVGKHPVGLGGRSAVLRPRLAAGGTLARTTGHPHTKPLDLVTQLLLAAPPGTVADPFLGSGTTLRAAKDLGRKAIGVEIEERYCEIAAKRLSQEVLAFGESA